MYGEVTLQDELTIGSGETLTVPEGSKLDCNCNLTNNGTILVESGGTLSGGTAPTMPNITGQPTGQTVEEGATATFTVTASDAQTYQWQQKTSDSSDWKDISGATSATYSIENTATTMSGYQYRCVVTAGGVSVISNPATLTVQAKPAPVSVTGVSLDNATLELYTGDTATLTATVEPSDAANQNVTWQSNNTNVAAVEGGTVSDVGAGETDITVTTEDGNFTATCKVTVRSRPSYNPPTASEKAIDAIQDARPGDTVEISLPSGQTRLDKEVFEALAGRDVTLEVTVPGGVMWSVNGQDIPENAKLSDLDLGVTLDASTIPASVINTVTGAVDTTQLSLEHDGALGFTMTLTVPLGEGRAGLWANLYHYDEGAGRLVFRAASTVGDDGRASFALSHASEWAVVIDSASHELPFADVSPSDWFANSVGAAYRSGLMCGYADGSGLFGVGDALTREQLATVLWRAAGSPDAGAFDGSSFSDGGEASEWAGPALAWAVSTGVLGGSDDGAGGTALRPTEAVTRAEMAAMITRWLAAE